MEIFRNKYFLRIVVATLPGILLVGGCQSNRAATDRPAPSGKSDPTAIIWVKGMSCPLCANNINHMLHAVPGVLDVSVGLGDGGVYVTLSDDPRPTEAQLEYAVRQAGFTPDRIEWLKSTGDND